MPKTPAEKKAKRGREVRSFAPRQGETKQDLLMRMMQSPGGATSAEMEAALKWKPHSVRGLIGTLKKRGLRVESLKEKGEPVHYHLRADDQVGDVV